MTKSYGLLKQCIIHATWSDSAATQSERPYFAGFWHVLFLSASDRPGINHHANLEIHLSLETNSKQFEYTSVRAEYSKRKLTKKQLTPVPVDMA